MIYHWIGRNMERKIGQVRYEVDGEYTGTYERKIKYKWHLDLLQQCAINYGRKSTEARIIRKVFS